MTFTDARSRAWTIYEFEMVNSRRRKRALGDLRSEARAFVPDGWVGDVMIYRFGTIAYRELTPRILQQQLDASKPLASLRATSLNPLPDPAAQPEPGPPPA